MLDSAMRNLYHLTKDENQRSVKKQEKWIFFCCLSDFYKSSIVWFVRIRLFFNRTPLRKKGVWEVLGCVQKRCCSTILSCEKKMSAANWIRDKKGEKSRRRKKRNGGLPTSTFQLNIIKSSVCRDENFEGHERWQFHFCAVKNFLN